MIPIKLPIYEKLNMQTCWEHTPLSYYKYGEYPRFLRPVGAHQPRSEIRWVGERRKQQRLTN